MWLAEKTAAKEPDRSGCVVGIVTIGGERPSVLCEGELRNTELLHTGAVRLPKIGDEVLVVCTGDGDCIALGCVNGKIPDGIENDEIILTNGKGSVTIKNSGEILLTGDIALTGTVRIDGTLLINGEAYVPPVPETPASETGV